MILLIIPPEIQSIQRFRLFFTAELRKINDIAKSAHSARCEADLVASLDYCANGNNGKDVIHP